MTSHVLHERDRFGEPVIVPHGAVPSIHSFRHTLASRALLADGGVIDRRAGGAPLPLALPPLPPLPLPLWLPLPNE
jgi:integrase